jgi:hypothetical protein
MATITKGKTFVNGELVTPEKIHQLVDSATVTNIANADIAAGAAIADTKLAQISTAGKVLPAAVQGTAVITSDSRLSDARPPTTHNHDDRYYTETEMNNLLAGKQASGSYAPATGIAPSAITGTAVVTSDPRLSDARTAVAHTHDDRYYTEAEVDGKFSSLPAFSTDSFANTAMLRGQYGQSQATSYLGNDASLKTDSRWLLLNPSDSFSNYFAMFFHIVNGIGNGVGGISKVGTTGVAYNTSSDYRLKTNIEPLTAALARLLQIPVHRFNWLADPAAPKVDGFLAHEAQAIVPESVTGHKDEVDAEGKPVHQGIDQSKLGPLLVAAVQELAARVAALEAK